LIRYDCLIRNVIISLLVLFCIIFTYSIRSESDLTQNVLEENEKLHTEGKYSPTIPILEKLYHTRPYYDRIAIRYALALLYREDSISESDYSEGCRKAAKIFKEVIELHKGNIAAGKTEQVAMIHFYRGLALWFSRQPGNALQEFHISYQLNPDNSEAIYNQAVILYETEKYLESQNIMNLYQNIIQ
jgi:tetratricopeptide (TPR) repeat protein